MSCKAINSIPSESNFCKCEEGYYFEDPKLAAICIPCLSICKTCENAISCLSCKDTNSYLDANGLCTCKTSFYQNPSLSEPVCLKCKNECEICENSDKCITCADKNALLVEGQCICKDSYFLDIIINSCKPCLLVCEKCDAINTCISCKDKNALLVEGQCVCRDFYFLDIITNSCKPCLLECEKCEGINTCSSCKDKNSEVDDLGRCICKQGYFGPFPLENGSCELCNKECECLPSQGCAKCISRNSYITDQGNCACEKGYWNSSLLVEVDSCKECPKTCKLCNDWNFCIECKNNSIIHNGTCVCTRGFTLVSNICEPKVFSAILKISDNYDIKIHFEETLFERLTKNDFILFINNASVSFKLEEEKERTDYLIKPDYRISRKKVFVSIEIVKKNIYSISMSLLTDYLFESIVTIDETILLEQKYKKQATKAKYQASVGCTSVIFLSLGISLSIFDPSSFFNFLNIAEILYSFYLFNIEMNPVTREFLLGLRYHKSIPNLFNYILASSTKSKTSKKLKKFGYLTSSFLLNIGVHLSSLFILIAAEIFVRILGISNYFRSKILNIQKELEFSAFIRFWIQTFYEMSVTIIVSLTDYRISNFYDFLDYGSSIIFLVIRI